MFAQIAMKSALAAKAEFDTKLSAAQEALLADLETAQARLAEEDDLGALPREILAAVSRFEKHCQDALCVFSTRKQQLAASLQAGESLDFFSDSRRQ